MRRHCIRQFLLFCCCIWGVFLCSGFVAIGSSSQWRNKDDGKKRRLTFSKHAALYDNGDRIYPTDTLQNIGLNFTQSLVPDIAYYYLKETIGLSEETMWKITLEAGSVLGMTPRNLEKKISLLRRTMSLSDEDVRIILSKQPAILHYSAERNLGTTIIFLVRALDLSKQELRTMVLESPSILGYSVDNLGRKLSFFGNTLGYMDNNKVDRMERVRNLLVGTPKLLLSAVETGLMPRFQFLRNEIEFSLEELQLLYEKNPRLLLYSLDGNMREKIVFFFILQLHIEPENLRKLLLSFPKIMDYNLENHKKPIAEYYITELGFSNSELGSIVTRFPRLFSYSLFKIKHVTGVLRFELGLDATQVKRVIFQAPQIVGLDTEGTLKKKLDLLQTRLSLTSNELGLVVSKMPTLMNLGTENNLLPKIKYLERVVVSHETVKAMVLKQPTLLGYSLEKRIRPRMEKILTAGLSADKVTVGISMTESKFQGWLEFSRLRLKRHVDEGAQHLSRSRLSYLTEVLNLNQTEVDTLLASIPELKYIRANKMFQRRIDYFITELQNSTNATKSILMEKPLLLKRSIKKEWDPRIQKIREAGISDPQTTATLVSMPNAEFENWTRENEYSKTLALLRTSSIHFSQDDVDVFLHNLAGVTMSDANLVEAIKFLLELSSSSELDSVKMNVRDKPHLLTTPKAFEGRISSRESLLREVTKTYWHFDKISMIMMSQEEFDYKISSSNAKELLNQKLNFTEKEMDFILSRQPKSSIPSASGLAAKLDCLMSRHFDVSADIAILARPRLLSYHIDKIRNMTTVPLARRNKAKYLYEEETLDMLVAFGHTKGDASDIFYGSKVLGIRHPEIVLKPKLDMLLSAWEQRDIIAFALAKPLLYDMSVTELALLVKTGMLPSNTDNFAPLVADEIKAELNLTDVECARIFPMKEPDIQLKSTYQYLSAQFSSSRKDLKRVLLSEPNILSLPLSQVEPRMELLLEWGCDPANIIFISLLSRRKAEEFCMKSYLQREFELSQKQVDLLLQKVLTNRQSVGSLLQKIEYLLPNAFQGSRTKMKREILKNTSILTQSMALLEARIETLQLLEAVGFDVTEYGPLLSMSRSEFTNEFLPQRNSWSPMSTSEMDNDSNYALTADVREMVPPTLTISFSDDDNRDLASVVHWRC